jgi:hypothetical protein
MERGRAGERGREWSRQGKRMDNIRDIFEI